MNMADDPKPHDPEEVAADEISSKNPGDVEATGLDADAPETAESTAADNLPGEVGVPEFSPLRETPGRGNGQLDRFYDVHVPVWAELGRVELPLGELVKLSEGAVVRLERSVSEPVDIVSQGVKLARGEVIVIDDCFAIRIKEIIATK
jgi:flagellar motor switch protein FliN